jgi:hypothetical protein
MNPRLRIGLMLWVVFDGAGSAPCEVALSASSQCSQMRKGYGTATCGSASGANERVAEARASGGNPEGTVPRRQPVDSRRTVWKDIRVVDAIARYKRASEANDIDGLMATLAPDAELVSPLSGRMVFRGADDLRVLLTAVYGSMTGLHWHTEVGDGNIRVIVGEGKVGGFRLGDAMVLELGDDGRIRRIRPHLRPWLALTVLAMMLGPKVGRHPSVVWRALRAA